MLVMAAPEIPTPTARSRDDRWLGGVAGGLAARWGVPAGRVRLAFVLGTVLCLGLGAIAYAAAWLVLPAEGEDGAPAGPRGIVLLAQACGALLGLGALATLAAVGTVFGFGWVVVAVAASVLVGVAAGWPRLGPAWALLPVGALVLPSVALALGGLRLDPSMADATVAPARAADLPDHMGSGLGLLTVDLRDTTLPASGVIPLRIDAGMRRTLVALPHDRCVHVDVRQHPLPVASRVANTVLRGYTVLTPGGTEASTPGATIFGGTSYASRVADHGARPGPTLRLDYASHGGALVVRDYPDRVDPASRPDWPGYPVTLEPRPGLDGVRKRVARRVLAAWRERRRAQEKSKAKVDRLLAGPCRR
jgi:phage shock protein PspC (stress-responsive transcriptional regulator)